jgi:hypothetical protein
MEGHAHGWHASIGSAVVIADQFERDHAPGNLVLTASRWPTLALSPNDRPRKLPSSYALGAHMLGIVSFDDISERDDARRGKLMEPVGAKLAAEDHHLEIIAEQARFERRDVPALTYVDLLVTDPAGGDSRAVIELKTINERDFVDKWQDRPPLYPRVQCQCQMAITGDQWCYVGAIVMGYASIRLELFKEIRHSGMQQLLLDRAGEFMDMLRRGELPPMDESPSSYTVWAETAKLAEGETFKLLDPEAVDRAAIWRAAKDTARVSRETDEAAKAFFAARCGDAERIELLDGTIVTRKRIERKAYEVEASSYIQWRVRQNG